MNRAKIEDVLLKIGIPASVKGFIYIVDAVECIDQHGTDISITKWIYPSIAKMRNTTASKVERAIRHAFEIARSEKGDYEIADKYIGFIHCTNYNSLMMLHAKIRQECEEVVTKNNEEITESKIREIFRQELRLVLNDLREEAI